MPRQPLHHQLSKLVKHCSHIQPGWFTFWGGKALVEEVITDATHSISMTANRMQVIFLNTKNHLL
ncbi:hypothetical protein C4546_03625 [Candidatus Parcubacteria bacterium]|jgi:hypothetical protein|nr:MAG: hypothetical protein C4546_03625 [Candidatus Parcubacteria bacterium]